MIMLPTNLTEIKENNQKFAEKEKKENEDLENMVGDISGGGGGDGGDEDIFDRQLKESAKDDHMSLKESMIETYKDTMHSLNQDDP